MKLVIFGASGTGKTTLATAIAEKYGWPHLDTDDFYWEKTDIPFTVKRPRHIQRKELSQAFNNHLNVVVSGSLESWGGEWESAFDMAVFLKVPQDVRMQRLKKREIERYGKSLESDPIIKEKSIAFLKWASDHADDKIALYEDWIKKLSCETLIIKGTKTNSNRLSIVAKQIDQLMKSSI